MVSNPKDFAWVLSIVLVVLAINVQSAYGASREAKFSTEGMVASRSALASGVGADILARGGNAIDAAVATAFALSVTYPSAGNLGGGGFMVIRLADGSVVTNDHREKAPAKATRDMYLDDNGQVVPGLSTKSHLAVGVPGSVAGLLDVLEKYGTLSRAEVIRGAEKLAKKGFKLDQDLSESFKRRMPDFAPFRASAEIFSKAVKGKAKNERGAFERGELFKQTDLARTLSRIRRQGKRGFYEGKTADLLVAEMVRGGGLITHQDLLDYASVWREPIVGKYRGYDIYSMAPPSSGGALVVQMLNMLEPYDIKSLGFGSAATMHLMIEAERRAFADRAEHLGDTDFYPVPLAQLIDKKYARDRFSNFNPTAATRSDEIAPGEVWPESPDTTHLSVVDGQGNAVAYTTTLNLSYGSKIVAAGTGVLLNNEMDDFSAKENAPNFYGLLGKAANAIAPHKRMLSSMTPTIVSKGGKPVLVTGSPGGSTIITTTLQVIMNVIDHGMSLSDAVGKPRFHHQWQPDRILVEKYGLSPDTLNLLESMGHQNFFEMPFGRGIGDANSVLISEDGLRGMADPRNAGAAVGVR